MVEYNIGVKVKHNIISTKQLLLRHQQYPAGQMEPKMHNPDSPLLIGEVNDGDVVKETSENSYIDKQSKLI